ncbi:MAG TPA: hypothetical protein VHR45_03035 [Thermoanaerobaculia bacterium]|nr:hypothetical protein [Thermoanaerobaculia bacterium]
MRSTKLPSWSRRLLGFTPLQSPPHVFALDGRGLRYAQLGRERLGLRCRAVRRVALPPDAFASGLLGGPLRDAASFQRTAAGLVQGVPGGVREASLVVPDSWLRVTFAECGDLPRGGPALDEVLRWKLRRLVPFRVDELRVGAAEVSALPGQAEPRRLLMGFAIEQLLAQLEDAFAALGIRIGHISNTSLSLLDALPPTGPRSFVALALVDDDGYTLVIARRGEPVLHRYKGLTGSASPSAPLATPASAVRGGAVVRDLRLTRNFLDEHFPGSALDAVLLLARPDLEPEWLELLERGLGRSAAPVDGRVLPPLRGDGGGALNWRELAPMTGAARREVA